MYWLVSLPLGGETSDAVWGRLQELTTYANDYSVNFKFRIPSFRVGTLDSLMALSDDLVKVNAVVEGAVNKIRRQLFDIQSALPAEDRPDVWVEGMTPEGYVQNFAWQEAKYPSRRTLRETVTAISETVQKLEDDLKAKASELSQLRTAHQAQARRQAGSLAVRDLSDLLPPERMVDTEHLTTLAVVVPKTNKTDWLAGYETLSDFVVPRSSWLLSEDGDYAAFTVVLFRRVVDDFKAAARGKGFQVKDVGLDAGVQAEATEAQARLRASLDAKRGALEQWCITSYGEAFSGWIHVLAVRVFVESILRYGLPPQFLPALLRPHPKHTAKLRKVLAQHFGGVGGQHFTSEGGAEGELYPYVSFTLNLEEQ